MDCADLYGAALEMATTSKNGMASNRLNPLGIDQVIMVFLIRATSEELYSMGSQTYLFGTNRVSLQVRTNQGLWEK